MNPRVSATLRWAGPLVLAMVTDIAAAAPPDVAAQSQKLRGRAGSGTAISINPATGAARFTVPIHSGRSARRTTSRSK